MVTFILPGGSLKNKEWLEEAAGNLKVEGFIRPIYWEYWQDPGQDFDPKEKATLIARHTKGDKVNILAKSVGSLVASYIIEQIPDQINKVIFCGIPLHDISEAEKDTIMKVLASLPKENLICYQNETDPHASYAEVKDFIPPEVKLVSMPRADHHYPYYSEFNEFLAG